MIGLFGLKRRLKMKIRLVINLTLLLFLFMFVGCAVSPVKSRKVVKPRKVVNKVCAFLIGRA